MEQLTGKTLPVINIIGGGSKDKLMCQLTADACGKAVVAGPAEATSYGNLLVQLIAVGAIGSLADGLSVLRASFTAEEYQPWEQSRWNTEYGAFKERFRLD